MAKGHKEDYGSYILNNKENILKRKRKVIMIKRTILLLIVLFTILINLGLTLPEFNLTEVKVNGLELIPEEEVLAMAHIEPEINVFKLNTKKLEKAILENSYIDSVEVKRKLPNKISIEVKERKIAFYVETEEGIYAIDDKGMVLGVKESVEVTDILKLDGIPRENLVVGEFVQGEDKDGFLGAQLTYAFLSEKGYFDQYPQLKLEIINFVDYKLYVNNAYINLGTSENINDKLAKAFSILSAPEFLDLKGYVDVSFKGNPVVYKEN